MNTNDNQTVVESDAVSDDLETFEADFFGTAKPEKEVVEDEEVVDDESDAPSGEENDDPPATDDDEDDDEAEPEEDEDDDPKPKGKGKNRKSFQERINDLTAKAREAERREQEAIRRIQELEAKVNKESPKEEKKEEVARPQFEADAPQPDAMDDKGEALYPLGEFDPKFIRDLTRYTIQKERAEMETRAKEEETRRAMEEARNALQTEWTDKLEKAAEEIPTIREDIVGLETAFTQLDPAYGEYLASTIMACDYGPQILHYLSQNIGEAQKIVASGPTAATLAIGRLEARFVKTDGEETKRDKKKVSDAPPPPTNRTRGSGGKFSVDPTTDDLDAFEDIFFEPKRKR